MVVEKAGAASCRTEKEAAWPSEHDVTDLRKHQLDALFQWTITATMGAHWQDTMEAEWERFRRWTGLELTTLSLPSLLQAMLCRLFTCVVGVLVVLAAVGVDAAHGAHHHHSSARDAPRAIAVAPAPQTADVFVQDLTSASGVSWILTGSDSANKLVTVPAAVPGNVYTDLVTAKVLQGDPLARYNEKNFQWVASKDWTYTATFDLQGKAAALTYDTIHLEADGIDTSHTHAHMVDAVWMRCAMRCCEWRQQVLTVLSFRTGPFLAPVCDVQDRSDHAERRRAGKLRQHAPAVRG